MGWVKIPIIASAVQIKLQIFDVFFYMRVKVAGGSTLLGVFAWTLCPLVLRMHGRDLPSY
jgi:hypothetical protein